MKLENYLHLYLGSNTMQGKLVGVKENICFIQLKSGEVIQSDSCNIKPILKKLRDLSSDESNELIKKGFTIGRPNGYSFSNDALLYLLSNHVDIFGLIEAGLAVDQKSIVDSIGSQE